jgi:hypothetical protein
MTTAAQLIEATESELAPHLDLTRASRLPMLRRINVRQQQLFAFADEINPDYFGVCITGIVDQGGVDLWAARPPDAPAIERVNRVTIADPGSSEHAAGELVHVVSLHDTDCAFPPRVTIRDGVARQVATDLDGVVSLRVAYSRRPFDLNALSDRVELEGAYSELFVYDLALHQIRRAPGLSAEYRAAASAPFLQEEKTLLERFASHVSEYAGPLTTRFG